MRRCPRWTASRTLSRCRPAPRPAASLSCGARECPTSTAADAATPWSLPASMWPPSSTRFRQCCSGAVAIEPAARLEGEAYVVDGDAAALVKGYLPPGEDSAGVPRSLRLALRSAPLERPPRWRRARRLREEDWRDSWKRYFRPQRIGKRLLVKPSWATYEVAAGDTVIEIDPGMALGTGQHPTTAMCLRALEESASGGRPGDAVLDLGAGSGILAIAAARLGAGRVLGLDI